MSIHDALKKSPSAARYYADDGTVRMIVHRWQSMSELSLEQFFAHDWEPYAPDSPVPSDR